MAKLTSSSVRQCFGIKTFYFFFKQVHSYIAKRHCEETKKVELVLVKTWLFFILWKSLILLNSISRPFWKERGGLFKWWINSVGGVLPMITADYTGRGCPKWPNCDDVISEQPLVAFMTLEIAKQLLSSL